MFQITNTGRSGTSQLALHAKSSPVPNNFYILAAAAAGPSATVGLFVSKRGLVPASGSAAQREDGGGELCHNLTLRTPQSLLLSTLRPFQAVFIFQ